MTDANKQPQHVLLSQNIRAVAVLFVTAVVVVSPFWYIQSYQPKAKATNYIANLLKDPDSAQFRNVRLVGNDTVCGEVNAKNSYGAYIGFTSFVYTINPLDGGEYGFIGDEEPSINDLMSRVTFIRATERCTGVPHQSREPLEAEPA